MTIDIKGSRYDVYPDYDSLLKMQQRSNQKQPPIPFGKEQFNSYRNVDGRAVS